MSDMLVQRSCHPSLDVCLCSQVLIERASLHLLPWGQGPYLEALKQRRTAGADVLLGADVVYEASFIAPLMQTAAALLKPSPQVC